MKIDHARFPRLSELAKTSVTLRGLSRLGRSKRVARLVANRLELGPRTPLEMQWHHAIASSDALIISGAGAMTDQYDVQGIHSWRLLAGWASSLGKPTLAVGQGVGPVKRHTNRVALKSLLDELDYVGVRDSLSAAYVRDLGSSPRLLEVTPDWASAMSPTAASLEVADELIGQWGVREGFVAVSLHLHEPLAFRRRWLLQRLAKALVQTANRHNLPMVFVPNMTGARHSDDRTLAQSVISRLPSALRSRCHVHVGRSDATVVASILSRSRGIVSTRYHPLVFALGVGRPAIGIYFDEYYRRKLEGASAHFGVSGNVFAAELVWTQPEKVFIELAVQRVSVANPIPIAERLMYNVEPFLSRIQEERTKRE